MKRKPHHILGCSLFFTITTVLTVLSIWRAQVSNYPLGWMLSVSVFLACVWLYHYRGERSSHAVLGLMSLVFIPFYGLLFSSGVLLWSYLYPPPEEGKGEAGLDEVRLFKLPEQRPILSQFETMQDESFIPAVSLLKSKNVEERRSAIEVLAQIGGPEQIRHLQTCLEDDEREIYQLAHAKLTALHERYTDKIRKSQTSQDSHLVLGRLIDYLESGLLGEATRNFYAHQAISVAVELLSETPKDIQLLTTIGGLYFDEKKLIDAEVVYQKALESDPDCLEAHWGLCQIYYQKRDFDSLKERFLVIRKLTDGKTVVSKEILDVLSWWFESPE